MTPTSTRARQILYGLLILGIFAGMVPYSAWLEREKDAKDLGEATLGQVDAGSFMLKLALLGGARGIAANMLWTRAVELQRLQEWDKLKATVDLITKLQPHFLSIWTFQGWNLAYNVSVEWDDPADKYVWIKEGVKFLQNGVDRNPRSPDLTWDTAWTYYHKIGFSDEAIILRRQFYEDDEDGFKVDPVENQVYRDNFQVARGWFELAIDKADTYGERLAADIEAEAPVEYVDPIENRKGRPGDLAFRSMPAHAQTRYASALVKQSISGIPATFGEKARNEWQKSRNEWLVFGNYVYESPNQIRVQGRLYSHPIRLIDALDPTETDRLANNTEHWARVLGIPQVTPEEAAMLADNQKHWQNRWASQMNLPYWLDRASAEMELDPEAGIDAVRARQLFYEATRAFLEARYVTITEADGDEIPGAIDLFREGLEIWERVLDRHPTYRDDDLNQKDTGVIVRRYVESLRQAGEEIPPEEEIPFGKLLSLPDVEDNPDPFDELEMLRATGGRLSGR